MVVGFSQTLNPKPMKHETLSPDTPKPQPPILWESRVAGTRVLSRPYMRLCIFKRLAVLELPSVKALDFRAPGFRLESKMALVAGRMRGCSLQVL